LINIDPRQIAFRDSRWFFTFRSFNDSRELERAEDPKKNTYGGSWGSSFYFDKPCATD